MGEKNGWTKYLVGVLVSVLLMSIGSIVTDVVANEEKSQKRDACIIDQHNADMKLCRAEIWETQKENDKKLSDIQEKNNEMFLKINGQLGRIEAKIEKL